MTYIEFISQFTVFNNPPLKSSYNRHHIVPISEQTEPDDRQVYLTWAQHFWAHILYDREHSTKTADWFLKICGKPAEFFDCYEKCLAYSYTYSKKQEIRNQKIVDTWSNQELRDKQSEANKGENNGFYGKHHTEESRKNMSESHKGMVYSEERNRKVSDSLKGINTWIKGRHWYNNGVESVIAYECPEGYVPGRLYSRNHSLLNNQYAI